MFRIIFTLPLIQWVVATFVAVMFMIVYATCRVRYRGSPTARKYKRQGAIWACWHGRIFAVSCIAMRFGIRGNIVASRHRDGRLMAKVQYMFGQRAIYGSTGRAGAVDVFRQGLRILKDGGTIGISPDGPKGPHMRLHDGILYFAKMSGAPIIPCSFSCSRPKFQNRWDRFLIVPPFSRVEILVGEPFFVARDEDIEDARTRLEKLMQEQTWNLDDEFGLPRQQPGKPKQ